jgi:hypothetical protein
MDDSASTNALRSFWDPNRHPEPDLTSTIRKAKGAKSITWAESALPNPRAMEEASNVIQYECTKSDRPRNTSAIREPWTSRNHTTSRGEIR